MYTNISEHYGGAIKVALQDYLDLNPYSEFVELHGEIREYWTPEDDEDDELPRTSWGNYEKDSDGRYYRVVARS